MSQLEQFREQCAKVAEAMPKFSTNGSVPLQDRIAEKIRAMPLPESSIQHKNMICMAECMDMVRSELIEMGVINSSVPPMMIADAVGDKLKESTEALRKENELLLSLLTVAKEVISWTEVAYRPPVRDEIETGRMVLVRLHSLADLQTAITNAEGGAA